MLTVVCAHLDSCLPSEHGGFGENFLAHTAGPYQYATNASFGVDWPRLARAMRRSRHIAGLLEVGCEG